MAANPLLLLLLLWAALVSPALSQTCSSQKFTAGRVFDRCVDLPQHKAYLHWTHDAANSSLSIGYVAAPPSGGGWVAWAINPTATGMLGAQSLIAFKGTGGTMTVKTYSVDSYKEVKESKLSFEVWDLAAESVDGSTRIFAKIKLPEKKTTVNQVWQVGPSVAGGVPQIHAFGTDNLNSKGSLDLAAGQAAIRSNAGAGDSKVQKRNLHGILNVISWGILFPTGVIIARYLRVFPSADPLWFYLHVSCQMIAYILGTAGWGIGMKLGNESEVIQYSLHRNIGIALFCLSSLQISALIFRPHKGEPLRLYWDIYHHSAGFTVVVMGIFNVIKGIEILNPEKKWQTAYYVVLFVLLALAVLLEAITWIVVLKRKSGNGPNKST